MNSAHQRYPSRALNERRKLIAVLGLLFSTLLGAPAAGAERAVEPSVPLARFENPLSRVGAASQQMGGINTIVQDSYGFIWMGGENGVGRYDGHKLRVYQAEPQNPRTLLASYTTGLALDRDGTLWQATEGGLSRYHPETDDFTRIHSLGGASFASEAVVGLAVATITPCMWEAPGRCMRSTPSAPRCRCTRLAVIWIRIRTARILALWPLMPRDTFG